jgi:hypothetical protein
MSSDEWKSFSSQGIPACQTSTFEGAQAEGNETDLISFQSLGPSDCAYLLNAHWGATHASYEKTSNMCWLKGNSTQDSLCFNKFDGYDIISKAGTQDQSLPPGSTFPLCKPKQTNCDKKSFSDKDHCGAGNNKFMTFPYYDFNNGTNPVSLWNNKVCANQKRTFWTVVVDDNGTNQGRGVIGNCGCIGTPNDGCQVKLTNDYWNFLPNDQGDVGTPMKITVNYDQDYVTVGCASMEDEEDAFQGSCP